MKLMTNFLVIYLCVILYFIIIVSCTSIQTFRIGLLLDFTDDFTDSSSIAFNLSASAAIQTLNNQVIQAELNNNQSLSILPLYTRLQLEAIDIEDDALIIFENSLEYLLDVQNNDNEAIDVSLSYSTPSNHSNEPIIGVITGQTGDDVMALNGLLTAMHKPFISGILTSVVYSDKSEYPYMSRLSNSNSQALDLVLLLFDKFQWQNCICIFATDYEDDALYFTSAAQNRSNPVSVYQFSLNLYDLISLSATLTTLTQITTIIVFIGEPDDAEHLLQGAELAGLLTEDSALVWIGVGIFSNFYDLQYDYTTKLSMHGFLNVVQTQAIGSSLINANYTYTEANHYDIPYVFAHALNKIAQEIRYNTSIETTNIYLPLSFSGKELLESIHTVSFQGLSGYVQLKMDGERVGYFDIQNMDNYGNLVTVANFDGLGEDLTWSNTILWPNSLTSAQYIPSDTPPITFIDFTNTVIQPIIAISSFLIVVSISLHIMLYRYSHCSIIRSSNTTMMHIILLGCSLAYVSVIISSISYPPSSKLCMIFPFLLEIGFDLAVGSLLLKVWQIHTIFLKAKLIIVKTKTIHLVRVLSCILLLTVITYIIWITTDPLQESPVTQGSNFIEAYECTCNKPSIWYIVILTPKALMLVTAAALAFRVRNVSSNFNESKFIGLTLYNIIFIAIITFSVRAIESDQHNVLYAVTGAGIIITTVGIQLMIFLPKFWSIYNTDNEKTGSSGVKPTWMDKPNKSSSSNSNNIDQGKVKPMEVYRASPQLLDKQHMSSSSGPQRLPILVKKTSNNESFVHPNNP